MELEHKRSLLSCIKFADLKHIELVLGELGLKIAKFVYCVDINHPHATDLFASIFSNDETFVKELEEVLSVVKYCDHLSIGKKLHKLIDLKKISKSFNREGFGARLLTSIDKVRSERAIKPIDLNTIVKKGEMLWKRQPDNFSSYEKGNSPFIKDIETLELKAKTYSWLGCEDLASGFSTESNILKSNLDCKYYGYNRITVTIAAMIIAKMHGCKLKTSWDRNNNKTVKIIKSDGSDYKPELCPLHEMFCTPRHIIEKIHYLDAHPEVNNKPIFDAFLVIVPYLGTHAVLLGEKDGKCYYVCQWSKNEQLR
jgi:hypothetical protein